MVAAREVGRFSDAARLAKAARDFLRAQPTDNNPMLSAALPELHFQWGLTRELAGDFDDALAGYNDAYNWALSTGQARLESSAAAAAAVLHALDQRRSAVRIR